MRAPILPLILIRVGPGVAAKAAPAGPRVEASFLRGLKARSIGPAIMGGRVADIALDPKDPYTFYVALGTGGLMKTADNGGTAPRGVQKGAGDQGGARARRPPGPKGRWAGRRGAPGRESGEPGKRRRS